MAKFKEAVEALGSAYSDYTPIRRISPTMFEVKQAGSQFSSIIEIDKDVASNQFYIINWS